MQVVKQFQGVLRVVVAEVGAVATRGKIAAYTEEALVELLADISVKAGDAGVFGTTSVALTESPSAQMSLQEAPGYSHRLSNFTIEHVAGSSGEMKLALVADIYPVGKMGQVLYQLLQTKPTTLVFDLEAFTKDAGEDQVIVTPLTWNIVPSDVNATTVAILSEEVAQSLATHRHYKGGLYRIIGPAQDSESNQEVVVYEHLFPHPRQIWVRPSEMFFGKTEDGLVRFQALAK